jgi:hypothetical protein
MLMYGAKLLISAHPEMANFRNIGVGLRMLILKILNVWMPVPMFFIGVVNPAMAGRPP